MSAENLYWVWLSCRLGAANCDFVRLALKYDNPYEIYRADQTELSQVDGISEQTQNALLDKRLEEAAGIVGYCAGAGVGILPYSHPDYPYRLRMLKDPPVLLYVRGRLPRMDRLVCIAVVGTRRMSEYGRESAYRIAYELGAAGAVVVSGLALGIDGVAACGALSARGKTVAVLGSGIDIIYPREHKKLMQLISENGAVVTEYAPGTPPAGEHFPVRNRIISGMCQGTLVVEADIKSGAMITARTAHEQGRQVFAIPGIWARRTPGAPTSSFATGQLSSLRPRIFCASTSIYTARALTPQSLPQQEKSIATRARCSLRWEYRQDLPPGARHPSRISPRLPPSSSAKRRAKKSGDTGTENKTEKTGKQSPEKLTARDYIDSTKEAQKEEEPPSRTEDDRAIVASLDEKYRRLYESIPADRAVPLDALARLGYSIGEVMSAVTMLEVKGLISSLPGGLYIRR